VRYNSDGSLDTTFDGINTLNGTPTFIENGTPVVLNSDVAIQDAELRAAGSYAGATLTLVREGGANSQDVFGPTGNLAALTEGGTLEPISQSLEEDTQASELDEAEEVLRVVLPSDDDPAAIESMPRSVRSAISLRIVSAGVHLAWQVCCDWIGAARSFRCRLSVILHRADRCHMRDLRPDFRAWLKNRNVLNQANFVMICYVRANRERQAVTIHDRHDFQAFSSLRRANIGTSTFRHPKGRVDEALCFVQHATCAKLVGDVGQNSS
jgi:hypothetical protein